MSFAIAFDLEHDCGEKSLVILTGPTYHHHSLTEEQFANFMRICIETWWAGEAKVTAASVEVVDAALLEPSAGGLH